jgi:hypothetical protein
LMVALNPEKEAIVEFLALEYRNYITDSDIEYLSGSNTTICFLILSSLIYHTVCVRLIHIL